MVCAEQFLTPVGNWENILEALKSLDKEGIIAKLCLEEKLANAKVGDKIHFLRKIHEFPNKGEKNLQCEEKSL